MHRQCKIKDCKVHGCQRLSGKAPFSLDWQAQSHQSVTTCIFPAELSETWYQLLKRKWPGGVRDAGLKDLAQLKKLMSRNLGNTAVTDAGVEELQKALPDCRIYKYEQKRR